MYLAGVSTPGGTKMAQYCGKQKNFCSLLTRWGKFQIFEHPNSMDSLNSPVAVNRVFVCIVKSFMFPAEQNPI